MRHTVVISDVHLCEIERSSGLWMRYRQRPFSPDGAIAEMLSDVLAEVEPGSLTLVLNGDVFDFDAPRVKDGRSVFVDEPRTPDRAVPHLDAILDDHPVFVAALARLIAERHRIVFVSGNHDVELTLPSVRERLRERLVDAARRASFEYETDLAARVE